MRLLVKQLTLRVGKVAILSLQMRSCTRVQTLLVLTLRHHRLRLMIPQSQVSFPLFKSIHRGKPNLNRVGLVEFGIQCPSGGEQCTLQVSRHMHTLRRTFQTPTNKQYTVLKWRFGKKVSTKNLPPTERTVLGRLFLGLMPPISSPRGGCSMSNSFLMKTESLSLIHI